MNRFRDIVSPAREVRFGIAGLGMGSQHLLSLTRHPANHIAAIADLRPEYVERCQQLLRDRGRPPAEVCADLDALLTRTDLDAVTLALPIHLNGMGVLKSLRAGFHTFGEKPIANNIPQALEICELVRETGRVYQCGFELRNSPLMVRVAELIAEGHIGAVTAISAYHFWRVPPKVFAARGAWMHDKWAGNVLMDCMSHTFDLINLLAGGKVAAVYGDLGRVTQAYAGREVPECGSVTVRYDSGVRASVAFTETCDAPGTTLITVAGDDGKIEVDFCNAGSFKIWFRGKVGFKREEIDPLTTHLGHLGFHEQFVEFRNAVVENRQPYCGAAEGLESLLCSVGSITSNDVGRPLTREEILAVKAGEK